MLLAVQNQMANDLTPLYTVCVYKLGYELSATLVPSIYILTRTETYWYRKMGAVKPKNGNLYLKHDYDDILIKQLQGKSYMCRTLFSIHYLIKPKIYLMTARLKISRLQINSKFCRQTL